jgi:hypothetical protein
MPFNVSVFPCITRLRSARDIALRAQGLRNFAHSVLADPAKLFASRSAPMAVGPGLLEFYGPYRPSPISLDSHQRYGPFRVNGIATGAPTTPPYPSPNAPQTGECRKRVEARRTFKRLGEFGISRGDPCQEMAMSAIPLHLQRRFEQKWAFRFGPPVAVNPPKNVGAKTVPITPTGRGSARQRPKKAPPM